MRLILSIYYNNNNNDKNKSSSKLDIILKSFRGTQTKVWKLFNTENFSQKTIQQIKKFLTID